MMKYTVEILDEQIKQCVSKAIAAEFTQRWSGDDPSISQRTVVGNEQRDWETGYVDSWDLMLERQGGGHEKHR